MNPVLAQMIEEFWHLRTVLAKPRFLPLVRGAASKTSSLSDENSCMCRGRSTAKRSTRTAVNRGSAEHLFVLPRHVVSCAHDVSTVIS